MIVVKLVNSNKMRRARKTKSRRNKRRKNGRKRVKAALAIINRIGLAGKKKHRRRKRPSKIGQKGIGSIDSVIVTRPGAFC